MKYALPNGRSGVIIIGVKQLKSSTVKMNISDNGIGITETVELDNTKTLGLELVRTLVEQQLEEKLQIDRRGAQH